MIDFLTISFLFQLGSAIADTLGTIADTLGTIADKLGTTALVIIVTSMLLLSCFKLKDFTVCQAIISTLLPQMTALLIMLPVDFVTLVICCYCPIIIILPFLYYLIYRLIKCYRHCCRCCRCCRCCGCCATRNTHKSSCDDVHGYSIPTTTTAW